MPPDNYSFFHRASDRRNDLQHVSAQFIKDTGNGNGASTHIRGHQAAVSEPLRGHQAAIGEPSRGHQAVSPSA